jgi:hypothetical protein
MKFAPGPKLAAENPPPSNPRAAAARTTAPASCASISRGYSGAGSLEEISWDEWYEKFQENNLTFLYQDRTKDGRESRFFKLVCAPNKSGSRSRSSSAFELPFAQSR